MRSIGYHFFEDSNEGIYRSNRSSDAAHLVINCCGNFVTESVFTTHAPRGRADYYFLLIISGNLEMTMPDGEDRVCDVGDFVIIPPNTPYRYRHREKNSLNYFWVHFTGRDAGSILTEYCIQCYPTVYSVNDSSSVSAHFKKILDSAAKQNKFKERELSILFDSLLLSCARALTSDKGLQLKKSISYINLSYNTELRIPVLAKMENLSVSRYNAVFKQIMGISPIAYITKIRLSFACELLRGTNLSVKEIAGSVGYSDAHFFTRIFNANIGISPKEYRKNI